jgi:hypothetical protein
MKDGELYYTIVKGRRKMPGEEGHIKLEQIWHMGSDRRFKPSHTEIIWSGDIISIRKRPLSDGRHGRIFGDRSAQTPDIAASRSRSERRCDQDSLLRSLSL